MAIATNYQTKFLKDKNKYAVFRMFPVSATGDFVPDLFFNWCQNVDGRLLKVQRYKMPRL